jgi:hypothetical protein
MPFFQELEVIRNTVNAVNSSGTFREPYNGRTSGNSVYDTNTLQFPLDIGSADKGHYLMFNINAQKKTQFSTDFDQNTDPTVIANMQRLQAQRGGGSTNFINENFNKVLGTTISGIATAANWSQGALNAIPGISTLTTPFTGGPIGQQITKGAITFGENLGNVKSSEFLRTIKRITDTVVLYMPDKITYSNSQDYEGARLGGEVKSLAGLSAAATTAETKGATNLATFGGFLAAEASGSKALEALATAVTQVVKNPMLEVMYKGVKLRKFKFSFSLWPRSEQEAEEVQKIIALLRFHQAPEIKQNTGGFFLIPPSEFDISFMYNGKVNPNMDAISTCVLEDISVDYTPKGFHAYESIGSIDNPQLGRTGMPVGINLSLSFMETQIITKEYYKPYETAAFTGVP